MDQFPDICELTRALIRCPSVTPADAGALDVLQKVLEEMGFICYRLPFGQDVACGRQDRGGASLPLRMLSQRFLQFRELRRLRRTGAAATGEDKRDDPHFAVQVMADDRDVALVGQHELRHGSHYTRRRDLGEKRGG